MSLPTKAGPDTICTCNHWYEEHIPTRYEGKTEECHAPNCFCKAFEFDPAGNTAEAVADRGGDPAMWPYWMKEEMGNV